MFVCRCIYYTFTFNNCILEMNDTFFFQLDVYASHSQALKNGKKMSGAIVPVGNFSLPVYIAPLPNDK